MKTQWLTDDRCYFIYFSLVSEPECSFEIDVNYDIDTNQYSIRRENYLTATMDDRMICEISKTIKKIYGKKVNIICAYDSSVLVDENTTLEDVKTNTEYWINLHLEDNEVKKYNLHKQAKKLFLCHNKMKEKGYHLKHIFYKGKTYSPYRCTQEVELPDIVTIEDVEKLLEKALLN